MYAFDPLQLRTTLHNARCSCDLLCRTVAQLADEREGIAPEDARLFYGLWAVLTDISAHLVEVIIALEPQE